MPTSKHPKITSKSQLAIILSKLQDFRETNVKLEQYSTPSEIAAAVLWDAYMNGDIEGKTVLDAACGPGFFGIGALMLGAKKVYFVDIDKEAIEITSSNLKASGISRGFELLNIDISDFENRADAGNRVDVILQNPPFGTKTKHIDKLFLEVAFNSADVVYSMHKKETKKFVERISEDHGFEITHYREYDFALKNTMKFHKKKVVHVMVGCWRFEKKISKLA